MLHMSSTHQMQQIHPNDLSLICPYVGVMGVRVRCSLPETGLEQAKKPNRSTAMANFRKNKVPDPPPNPYISEKPFSRAFRIYPTYPPLRNTQLAEIRHDFTVKNNTRLYRNKKITQLDDFFARKLHF